MFTEVDKILYTDRCEVIEFPSQRFVYPIYKNGSTTLYKEQKEKQLRIYINNQIKKIKKIEIYIREPKDRISSGLATFTEHVLRDNSTLDFRTIEYFASNFLFLDKHYMPQFLWLYNLHRFTDENCLFEIKDINELKKITSFHENQIGKRQDIEKIKKIDAYIRLDNILYSLINQTITWKDLIKLFIEKEPFLYNHVFRERHFNAVP